MRRLKVERLTPSAAAACVRVYANLSTCVASRAMCAKATAPRVGGGACRCAF